MMTKEEMRIAIAEKCGWEFPIDLPTQKKEFFGYYRFTTGMAEEAERVPDYPNDLNAMHEAEKVLSTTDLQVRYWFHLRDVVYGKNITGCCCMSEAIDICFATTIQKSEAFLKTFNLWK